MLVGEVYFSYQLTWVVLDKGPLNVCVCVQENLSKPLRSEDIDASSGILMPYYDFDTKVMFLAGKVCIAFLRVYVEFMVCENFPVNDNRRLEAYTVRTFCKMYLQVFGCSEKDCS